MISICMGIYNGEKYIAEQLESILKQTVPPDEVVLCDDGSSDKTVDVILGFLKENGLEETWRLFRNETNKGYPGNFYYAMSLCKGDIVFLADQDDIWDIHKLEYMCRALEQTPQARAVCCKFGLVDAQGAGIHSIMAPARTKGTGRIRRVSIGDVFYKCEWPGMVLAYRREWFQNLWKSWESRRKDSRPGRLEIPHDFLVCAWAAEEEGFLQMDEELAWHRRHDNNAGGEEHRIARLLNRKRKLREVDDYIRILDAFDREEALHTPKGREALHQKNHTMKDRREALASGKALKIAKNAWKHRKSVRLMTAVCDVAIALKGEK